MPCAIKNCKIKTGINPKTGLCTSCDQCFSGLNKRMQSQERQSVAREQHLAQRRGGDAHGVVHSEEDQLNPVSEGSLPKVDLAELVGNYNQMETNGTSADTSKVLKDILGVVINMYAKSDDIETVKKVAEENSNRISQLEAKVGKPEDIALPLGLAVRFLPLPCMGVSELDNVRMAFKEKNYETYNRSERKQVFASYSKFQI